MGAAPAGWEEEEEEEEALAEAVRARFGAIARECRRRGVANTLAVNEEEEPRT